MSDVKSINNHHPKSLLVELLRLLCRPLDGPDDSNGYLDVHLVCRDGVVGVRTQISQIDVTINLRVLPLDLKLYITVLTQLFHFSGIDSFWWPTRIS